MTTNTNTYTAEEYMYKFNEVRAGIITREEWHAYCQQVHERLLKENKVILKRMKED